MITVEGLSKRFDETVALADVSLRIGDGEFVLLAGPNGSGKTTLVRHFNGLLEPDSGTVTVDGRSVTEHPVQARTSVGMVFQQPQDQFVASTVGADVAFGPENLGLARETIDDRVETALAAVNMRGRENDRIETLSGGEQARVAIAGALAMEPDHLVLDEPFAALDEPARQSVLTHLDGLRAGGTGIVVVTHDLRGLVERTDHLLAMADGRLVVDDRPPDWDALADLDVYVPTC